MLLKQTKKAGTPQERLQLFSTAMRLAAQAIKDDVEKSRLKADNKRLLEKAETDALTGMPNRAGVMRALTERVENVRQCEENIQTAVVFIDLDGFKAVNDALGHEKGDRVLQSVSLRLSESFGRRNDVIAKGRSSGDQGKNTVGRLGGDEVLLLLSYDGGRCLDEQAVRDKIRSSLEGLAYFDKVGKPYPIGASIGIASFKKDDLPPDLTAEEIVKAQIAKADKNMYLDKWHGGKPESLPGGAQDPCHPKNQRSKVLERAALDNRHANDNRGNQAGRLEADDIGHP